MTEVVELEQLTDWLGNDYGPGDLVLYAAMSGRSVTMVLGRVVKIYKGPTYGYAGYKRVNRPGERREFTEDELETKVQIQPLKSARWKQHYGRTRYIDTRTGKGIDPYTYDKKTGVYRHMDGGYYEHAETGEQIPEMAKYLDVDVPDEIRAHHRWPYDPLSPPWKHVRADYKPYVQKVEEGPKAVTISVIENIVKWTSQ